MLNLLLTFIVFTFFLSFLMGGHEKWKKPDKKSIKWAAIAAAIFLAAALADLLIGILAGFIAAGIGVLILLFLLVRGILGKSTTTITVKNWQEFIFLLGASLPFCHIIAYAAKKMWPAWWLPIIATFLVAIIAVIWISFNRSQSKKIKWIAIITGAIAVIIWVIALTGTISSFNNNSSSNTKYIVDEEKVQELLDQSIFTDAYQNIDTSKYSESSKASKDAFMLGIRSEEKNGKVTVNPLFLASVADYLHNTMGYTAVATAEKPSDLYDSGKLNQKGVDILNDVNNVIYKDDTMVFLSSTNELSKKYNSGSTIDACRASASTAGISGDTAMWYVVSKAKLEKLGTIDKYDDEATAADKVASANLSDDAALCALTRCGNIVTNAQSSVIGKTDNDDPDPEYNKDKTKGTQGNVVNSNDESVPGEDTNNGVGARTSTKEKSTNSNNGTLSEYQEKVDANKAVNEEQKTGDNNASGTDEEKDIDNPTLISKPAETVDGESVGDKTAKKKTPTPD